MTHNDLTYAHDENEQNLDDKETMEDKQTVGSTQENMETMEQDEEESDPFAEEKSKSIAMINDIAQFITKIEETVSRHKTKAECLKLGAEDHLVFEEKVYHAAKANRYDTGMSSEFLMKYLMQLDNCLSYGSASIKSTRKALVCRIKEVMAQADCLSQRWLKRVKLLENLKAEAPTCSCSEKTEMVRTAKTDEATKMHEEQIDESDCEGDHEDSAPEMSIEEPSDDETDEEETNDDVDTSSNDQTAPSHASETPAENDSALGMSIEEPSDDETDEEQTNDDVDTSSNDQTTPSHASETPAETKQTESTRLPSWQPRTQMYHEHEHVVVAAFVPGMNMDKFNIMVDGSDLLVTGTKRPTMQDIISYQHGRAQHFGNLNLKIALPTDVVHTEGATATYEDGVLRIKFVKKNIAQYHRPSRAQAYRQPMHYRRPMHFQQPTRRRNLFSHPLGFW